MHHARAVSGLLLLLGLASAPARAADPTGTLDPPSLTRARGRTTIAVRGRLTASPDGPLVVRLRRATPGPLDDDRAALETPPALGADGALSAELVTSGLLAPGSYTVEVAPAGDARRSALSAPLAIGTPDEVAAADRRLVAWYRGASGTFRELAAGLERRGQYHLALLLRTKVVSHRTRFVENFLPGWRASLLAARMDLTTWERRLVLPAHAKLGLALVRLVPLLEARARAWAQAFNAGATLDLPTKAAVDLEARSLCDALASLDPDPAGASARLLAEWDAGELATPPPGAPAGTEALKGVVFTGGWGLLSDPTLGFALDVPEGATAAVADQSPNERVVLDVAGPEPFRVVVQVRDLAGVADADLPATLEVSAWEGYASYERRVGRALTAEEGGPGLRLELDAEVTQREDETTGARQRTDKISAVQRSVWRRLPGGAVRVVTVVVVRAPGAPWSAAMARLETSLKLLRGS